MSTDRNSVRSTARPAVRKRNSLYERGRKMLGWLREEEAVRLCQNPNCKFKEAAARGLYMVCHHPQCSEDNHDKPLLLCRQCDLDIHRQPEFSGHLVLDATSKRLSYGRQEQSPVESDSAEDWHHDEDTVDGLSLFVKKPSKDFKRNKSPSEVERKLKRKKAVKKKSFSKNDSFSAPALEAALAQIACPEGPDMMASVTSETEGEVADGVGGDRKDSHTWDSLYFARLDGTDCSAPDSLPPSTPRTPGQATVEGYYTRRILHH
ncbi:uncharacterized protein LOC112557874 isoform X3 [Pomacea canaliculata]|uniref:uncharacterized protein LOC112557874 isoform X3 n=1 Tax=Pomacea canaliculata TaxID=400727 RepID=UPI000D72F279|nr:uncharacterized protein LOC112557874 isoform X3 [Pomacea canaliculata]